MTDRAARQECVNSWLDFNTYSRKKVVMYFIAMQLGGGLYYSLKHTKIDEVPVYHYSRLSSAMAGYCGTVYVPTFLRRPLFGCYAKVYGVDQDEMVEPLEHYDSFVAFFTRQVKPRKIDSKPNTLAAPADSKVLSLGEVKGNDVLLVKGMNYSLGEFLTGYKREVYSAEDLEKIKKIDQKKEKTNIYGAIFYLSPGDYHRYHSPCDFTVRSRKHIVGYLYPVKVSFIEKTPRVYEDNERVALFGDWRKGFMTQVYVGATNVGSMTLAHDSALKTNLLTTVGLQKVNDKTYAAPLLIKKGEEVGMFRLGSTVVMLFEAPASFTWNVEAGDSVKYGQTIGQYKE